MSVNGLKNKEEALGMSYGTAVNRLRKVLLFHLAQQLALDVCFRCTKKIESVTEFSVEHKQPWLKDVALFWDISNIAYSHLSCNARAADRSWHKSQRRIGPTGTEWCTGCKGFQPLGDFIAVKPGTIKRPANRTVRWYCKRHPRGRERATTVAGPTPSAYPVLYV